MSELSNIHSLHRKSFQEFHRWFLEASPFPRLCALQGRLPQNSKQCCSLSSSQSLLHITRALGPVWSFPQDPSGAEVFFKWSQQRDFSLHALWWCLTSLCILQTKCCALCQVKEVWLGKNCSCKASLLNLSLSAWQSLPCLLHFLTSDSMCQGRNRPLEKEPISPYLWGMPLLALDISAHSVGSLIYQVPSFLCALGFFSQLRRWENGEKEQ